MKDKDTAEEIDIAHGIMHMFQYNYKNQWVQQKAIFRQDRLWVRVFNDLVKRGFIERKKTFSGYQYRWSGKFPVDALCFVD